LKVIMNNHTNLELIDQVQSSLPLPRSSREMSVVYIKVGQRGFGLHPYDSK